MRRGTLTAVAVIASAVVVGGWLLQEGVSRADNGYLSIRVLQEVIDRVELSRKSNMIVYMSLRLTVCSES